MRTSLAVLNYVLAMYIHKNKYWKGYRSHGKSWLVFITLEQQLAASQLLGMLNMWLYIMVSSAPRSGQHVQNEARHSWIIRFSSGASSHERDSLISCQPKSLQNNAPLPSCFLFKSDLGSLLLFIHLIFPLFLLSFGDRKSLYLMNWNVHIVYIRLSRAYVWVQKLWVNC